jgi:NADH:ubiquinone oxidoreductase subunit 2 (subunit N)
VVGVGLVFFGGAALMALVHEVGNWLLIALTVAVFGFALYYYFRYLRRLEVKASEQAAKVLAPLLPAEKDSLGTGETGVQH